jgi:hypothetical protein
MNSVKANAVNAKGCDDFNTVLFEAYKLLFSGELINGFSANYQAIFNGKLHKSTGTAEFHASEDMD